MASPADIIGAARACLRTPWVHQGRMPGVALDCAGLVICVARAVGAVSPDFDVNGYARQPDGTLLEVCDRLMTRISAPELGAVVVAAIADDPQHLGILTDYPHGAGFGFIHACTARRMVIEHRYMPTSNFRVRRLYRLPGIAA